MSTTHGSTAPPLGVTPNFENPEDVLNTINLVTIVITIAVMAPLVLGRVLIRTYITKMFMVEDYFCVVAWALSTAYCVTGIYMGNHGGGNHDWEVTEDNMIGFQKALYADTISYGPAAWSIKTTLLLIFARVFSPFRRTVIFIYVFIFAMLMYYFPVMFIKIRICNPIEFLWTPDLEAVCFDRVTLFYCDTIMSALTDIVILVLPIPLVWSLHMPLKKKLRIAALLGAGGLATGASVVRLILVFQPNSFDDETVSFIRFNLLGIAEVGIGIICACLPAFNIFFTKRRLDRSRITATPTNRSNRSQYISSTKMSRMKSSRDAESSGDEGRSLTRVPTGTTCVGVTSMEVVNPMEDLVLQLERADTETKS
ncbi:hypothetical protein VTL71DRAFT_3865 [Oculimacula yallundae]|uniref:Rhodopsin domain-containing protein n=1 Tax=Oculimacula yallundae TaxID=86028 RepID=A0ABR4C5E9_9HELO